MSYTIDRNEAAKILGCSTRTVDRYMRAGKVRHKRVGKKVYINDEDIHIIQNGGLQENYMVLDADGQVVSTGHEDDSQFMRRPVVVDYKQLFDDAQQAINRKDTLIQELSYRIGQAEAELKNSISMIEYKKATLLLESAKKHNEEEKQELDKKVKKLEKRIMKGSSINLALIIAVSFLLVLSVLLWIFSL